MYVVIFISFSYACRYGSMWVSMGRCLGVFECVRVNNFCHHLSTRKKIAVPFLVDIVKKTFFSNSVHQKKKGTTKKEQQFFLSIPLYFILLLFFSFFSYPLIFLLPPFTDCINCFFLLNISSPVLLNLNNFFIFLLVQYQKITSLTFFPFPFLLVSFTYSSVT